MSRLATGFLTSFGLGFMKPASGTWGSTPPPALALGAAWAITALELSADPRIAITIGLVVLGVIFSVACVHWGEFAEQRWGKKDPGEVVADEVAGQCIALLWLPWHHTISIQDWQWNVFLAGTAFFTFRFFDILKPPPANQLQRLRAGWGILVDDLVAGAYALIVTQIIVRVVEHQMFG